jgi:hypothetical protein
MRKNYLKEHRPVLWISLLLSEKLYPHLREIDETAKPALGADDAGADASERSDRELESQRPDEMGGAGEQTKAQAEETILSELIYS